MVALTVIICLAAALSSSIGHAGASSYLAAMALFGVAPGIMKPSALTLNIIVALIATTKFYRAGCFSWSLFWPFAMVSIPFSYIGGAVKIPGTLYKQLVGAVLLFVAYRLFRFASILGDHIEVKAVPLRAALFFGTLLGLLSGLTGTGGGIFLSPLLLFMGWAKPRTASGVAAVFILVNSIAGLLGNISSVSALPSYIPIWAGAVVVGGWIGAEYGSRHLANATIRRLLAAVLAIAGLKLIFT
jgi:uncharacterized protein